MIVMKFGGSSVASATAIEWVANIVRRRHERQPVVVVSAMGKTTDRLQEMFHHAARGASYSAWRQWEDLRQFHTQETKRLLGETARPFLEEKISPLFRELHSILIELEEGRKATPAIQDQVLSYGERLSSEIVAAALQRLGTPATHVRAQDVIVTDHQFTHAQPLLWETYARLRRTVALQARETVTVMGGFIGSTAEGAITTLGRGGSDLTASLVGAGISADEIQIWTDVDGMLTCDPRILHGGYLLRSLAYEEAEEMARLGAKVLCAATVAPAIRQGIPISIRNSRHPEIEGTVIGPAAVRKPGTVKSIACRKGIAVVHLNIRGAAGLQPIAHGLHDLFVRHGVEVELVEARPDGVSFAVADSAGLPELLRSVDGAVQVTVEERMAVVSLVGDGITAGNAIETRMRGALGHANIRMTAQGSSRLSLSVAVSEAGLSAAVEELHREFFRTPDAAIFDATPESERRVPASTAAGLAGGENNSPALQESGYVGRYCY
jgi:aspartate kinase